MADVFISYSSKDRALAESLAQDIGAAGFIVWWDPEIRAGEDFTEVILRELEIAKAVIVVWTKHSVKSPWVRSEASRAIRAPRDRYIAVREAGLDEHDIPPPFDTRHAVWLEHKSQVLAALSRLLGAGEQFKSDAQIPIHPLTGSPTAEEETEWRALNDKIKLSESESWWKTEYMITDYLDFLERHPDGHYSQKVVETIEGGINYFWSESAGGQACAKEWEGHLKRIRSR